MVSIVSVHRNLAPSHAGCLSLNNPMILNLAQITWLNQHGGMTEKDVLIDENGLFVFMGHEKVPVPDDPVIVRSNYSKKYKKS